MEEQDKEWQELVEQFQSKQALQNKTTTQGQKASLSSGDYEVQQLTCIKHGDFESRRMFLYSDWGNWSVCPVCAEEASAEEKKRQAEEEARSAQRALEEKRLRVEQFIKNLLGQSGIPERFKERTLDNFLAEEASSKAVKAACVEYAKNFEAVLTRGSCMVFTGTTGTGKTHLACGIANYVMTEFKRSVVFVGVAKAIRAVKETYSKDSEISEQSAINNFVKPDLLILDEVGVQFGTDTEKLILFEILNERYMAMKPTILLSNLAADSLREYTGDRIFDRMRENGGKLLKFEWKSFRGNP